MANSDAAEFLQELTNYLDGVLDDRTRLNWKTIWLGAHCYVVCDTTKKNQSRFTRDSQLYETPRRSAHRLRSALWPSAKPQENRPAREPDRLQSSQQTDNVGGSLA